MLELIAFYKSASDYFSIQLFTLEVICPKLEIRFELSYYVFIHSKQVCCLNQKEIILLLVKKIFFQRTSTRLPSTKVGSAAAGRDDKKVEKYSNLSDNYHFVPVSVETYDAYALSFYRSQNVLCWSKFFEPAQIFLHIVPDQR